MKLSGSDILFMLFIGPIPPSMFKTKAPEEETPRALEVPTTEIGTNIPVLWGTRLIKNPKVVWYGDLRILKVKVDAQGKK